MGKQDVSEKDEYLRCEASAAYFIYNYVKIYDSIQKDWVPFHLWEIQFEVLQELLNNRLFAILKARQLGFTWLMLGYILWRKLFYPIQTVMLYSRREDEAKYLLTRRLKEMHNKLPPFLQARVEGGDSTREWRLSNESITYAFPTTAGDSYTATIVLADEADLIPDLDALMRSVKPTIDAGGQMILLSRSNKDQPASSFKNYYKTGKAGKSDWVAIFAPWYSHPGRSMDWYEDQKRDILENDGSLDRLHEQYPATDIEALAPKTQAKRLVSKWLMECYEELTPLENLSDAPAIPGLKVFSEPHPDREYVIGSDPAEGNPTSDDSSTIVMDKETLEECAILNGKFEVDTFSDYTAQLSRYYNDAPVLPERNNHGHAMISNLDGEVEMIRGSDGKYGWQTSGKSKAEIYSKAAELFKDRTPVIHNFETYLQLESIEGATLKAPKKMNDDLAMSYVLALKAATMETHKAFSYDY